MAPKKDYYKILKISPDATLKDIKKAYRRLALKYHPDKNTKDPDSEDKFKAISEAYSVLCDPVTRKRYDRCRSNYDSQPNDDIYSSGSWFDIFTSMGEGDAGENIGIHDAFNIFSRFMYEGGMAEAFQGDDGKYLFLDVPLDIVKNGGNVLVTTPDNKSHRVIIDGIISGGWKPVRQLTFDENDYWVVFRVDFPSNVTPHEKRQLQMNLLFLQTVNYAIPFVLNVVCNHPWWVALAAGAAGLAAFAMKN